MKRIMTFAICCLCGMILTGCGQYEYRKGISSLEEGEYKDAVTRFEKAIEEEKNVADSYRGIGLAKWEQQDYEGAAEALAEALEKGAQETATLYNLLGACKMQMGDMESAISYYEKGLSFEDCTDDMRREMSFNVIAAYEELEDWESAKAKLAEYVEAYPDDEQAAKEAEFLETR